MDEMQEIWDRAMVQAQSSRLDGRQQNENGTESGTGADVKSSIREIIDEDGYDYGQGVYLDTPIFNGVKPRYWGKVLGDFIYNQMADKELVMYDEQGNEETVRLARANDRVKKDGAKSSHKVLDKLARQTGDNTRNLAIVHMSELLKVSQNQSTSEEHSHQWLDENGWILRTAVIQDKENNVYAATLNIADGKRGKILYEINNVRPITGGNVSSTGIKNAGPDLLTSHNRSDAGTLPQTDADVKSKFKASSREQDAEELQRKYPNLDLNEDISELDGVPAIELTDGSIIPIPVNPQRGNRYTHVEFIEKNRIDVDDLKSGGWIGNGVYDSSFQSDTQRYIDRQKARKRVAELTGNEYQQFKGSSREYNYDYLASKDDMQLTEVVPKERYSRSDIVAEGMKNAAMFGYTNNRGNAVVYIKDTDTDVIVTEKSIRHGLDRRINNQAPVIEKLGEVLSNSVKVNELIPRTENTEKTFAYVGAAKDTDNRLYIATFIVNRNTNELESYDVLYAANAKKEPAALLPTSTDNSAMFTGSVISISDLLDKVNKLFPDILSEDVLRHFGRTERPQGKIGENVLYSSREMRDTAEEAKGREESAAVLRRENRILRERIEHWKKQSRVTKEHTLRNTDTLEYARELVKRLDSAATSAEVNQGLQEMGAYLLNAENVDWDMLWEHALTLAHSMTDDVDIVISDEMKAEREDFESFIKSIPVDVAPLVKAGEISYSDLKGYPIVHRKNGTSIDDLYRQLQERFGEGIFPDVPDGGDMIDNIKRYADAVQPLPKKLDSLTSRKNRRNFSLRFFFVYAVLSDKLDDGSLGCISAANADAGDAGVAAVALRVLGSDLIEHLLGNILAGDESKSLTVGSQILCFAKSYHFLGHGRDLFCAADGGFHSTLVQQIGNLLTEHCHALIGGLAEFSCSGHNCISSF